MRRLVHERVEIRDAVEIALGFGHGEITDVGEDITTERIRFVYRMSCGHLAKTPDECGPPCLVCMEENSEIEQTSLERLQAMSTPCVSCSVTCMFPGGCRAPLCSRHGLPLPEDSNHIFCPPHLIEVSKELLREERELKHGKAFRILMDFIDP